MANKVYLVIGPPCGGKTTYVQTHRKPGEIIIDADLIAQSLGSTDSHAHDPYIKALASLLKEDAIRQCKRLGYTCWIVTTSHEAVKMIQHTQVIEIDPGIDACLSRAKSRPNWTKKAIHKWYEGRPVKNSTGKRVW